MMALKKLFAAALAASLPMATLAQATPAAPAEPAKPAAAPAPKPAAPTVTLYGTFNANLQWTEAQNGAANDIPGRTAISTDSTNFGIRGALPLTDALRAEFQCETSAAINGLGVAGVCGRNSRLGLSGFWGTLFIGNWDTPYKASHYGTKADDPFGNTDTFALSGIISTPGYNVRSLAWNGGPTAAFDLRAAGSVAYWTPKFAGLGARVQYSTNHNRSLGAGSIDPWLVSASLNYDVGGLSLVAAGEYHADAFGIRTLGGGNAAADTSSTRDMAWRVAAGYELPLGGGSLTVMGMLEQLIYEQEDATAGFTDYDRLAWAAGARFRMGQHELRARYSMALDPNIDAVAGGTANEDDLGAQQIALGYAMHLSKATQLYLFWTQIRNDDRAQYTFSTAGAQNNAGAPLFAAVPAGANPVSAGVGIRHAF